MKPIRRALPVPLVGAAALLAATLPAAAPAVAAVPSGFTDELVTDGVARPTVVESTPDGRLLIGSQNGQLYVYRRGALALALDLTNPNRVCSNGERGLLGVAVHPGFASNGWIYIYYTHFDGVACDNRVSRFTLGAALSIDPASELVLLDNLDSPAANHNAGDLEIGPDGFLYVTVGDGGSSPARAQDPQWLNGKVLRITDDGGIPAGNPFTGAGTARCNTTGTTSASACQEIFALGFRNPFRFALDSNSPTTRFFVNDVGQNTWEEIDLLQAGGNFGWNVCEGNHNNGQTDPGCSNPPSGHVPPLFEYRHGAQIPGTSSSTNCTSLTGGAFVPDGLWPGFDGTYLFADVICGFIGQLSFNGSSWVASDFGSGLGSVVHLQFAPQCQGAALYYTKITATGGEVRRVARPAAPEEPLSYFTVTPCRLLDTRLPDGPGGGPPLTAEVQRELQLTGRCGIPAAARALAVNVTVVAPNGAGFLILGPGPANACTTSTLNFTAGRTRANNAILRLDAGGVARALTAGASANLIIDAMGYFTPETP